MTPLERVLERLEGVMRSGEQYRARCPAHDDKRPSLAVRETAEGRVLLHCFAGCPFEEIVAALGLEPSNLFPSAARRAGRGRG